MSIANSLQASVDKARDLHRRGNGDLEIFLRDILKDIECDIERVRGLETVAPINSELLQEYQEKGGRA